MYWCFRLNRSHSSSRAGTFTRRALIGASGLILISRSRPSRAATVSFAVTELAADGSGVSGVYGRAINRKATAVGIATGDAGPGAVRSRGETAWRLPISGTTSIANAINSAGVIAGSIDDRAAIWREDEAGMLAAFGTDRSTAYGINGAGVVVGSADKGANRGVALRWDGDAVEELPSLGGPSSRAVAINEDGLIAGYSTPDADGNVVRAVVWRDGELIELGTLGGEISQATAINAAGSVVGCSTSEEGFSAVDHAFVWKDATMTRLKRLGAVKIEGRSERVKLDRSIALGINADGDICGTSMSASENDMISVASLWIGEEAVNLNKAIAEAGGTVHLLSADGINDDRELVCTGYLLDDESMMPRMFRLVPE